MRADLLETLVRVHRLHGAAKAAISQFTKCLAAAVKGFGISVFAYSPGFVRTDLTEYVADPTNMPEGSSERFRERFDAGLDNSMEDATSKLMFLVSGKVDALTGRYINVRDPEDELIENMDTILSDNLYTLGLIK